ncbi:PhzF family phenazine biosynthesis protein [Bifidobacterium sp. CP2]|nr:PhzF family phenazine biosynthesis protein [Bifidobacterium sp. CP2]
MAIRQYVVDAFTDQVFRGNPAAVCLPESWPSDELMADIAMENRFSETAFAVREPEGWRLRWFTPGGERPVRARDARHGVCDVPVRGAGRRCGAVPHDERCADRDPTAG